VGKLSSAHDPTPEVPGDLALARAGDDAAFTRLVAPLRAEPSIR
jgi:hypothetical protein